MESVKVNTCATFSVLTFSRFVFQLALIKSIFWFWKSFLCNMILLQAKKTIHLKEMFDF